MGMSPSQGMPMVLTLAQRLLAFALNGIITGFDCLSPLGIFYSPLRVGI